MTNLGSQTRELEAVIRLKKGLKWKKTLLGVGWVLLAVWLRKNDIFSEAVAGLMLVFGGYCMAGDLVRSFAGFLPATIRDIRAALKGTNGKDRSDSTETD